MPVVVRTHGGLGNQLFQIFFARLLSECRRTHYCEIHDLNYDHQFGRSTELTSSPLQATRLQRSLSRLRIPKLLTRSGLRKREHLQVLGNIFCDGYFQKKSDYLEFSATKIRQQIDGLRRELNINPAAEKKTTLYHLRLGDFFANAEAARNHLSNRILDLCPGSTLITNQEELFETPEVREKLALNSCVLQTTRNFKSEDVLRLMSSYQIVITNNSTLALWASVLGGGQTEFTDTRLAELHEYLFQQGNSL